MLPPWSTVAKEAGQALRETRTHPGAALPLGMLAHSHGLPTVSLSAAFAGDVLSERKGRWHQWHTMSKMLSLSLFPGLSNADSDSLSTGSAPHWCGAWNKAARACRWIHLLLSKCEFPPQVSLPIPVGTATLDTSFHSWSCWNPGK